MSKFKKGDRVRICSVPPLDKTVYPTWETYGMDQMCGKEYVIAYVESRYVGLVNSEYVFNEEWIEHVERVPIVKVVDFGML